MLTLDTNVLIGITLDDGRLGPRFRAQAEDLAIERRLAVSSAVILEMVRLNQHGAVSMGMPPMAWCSNLLDTGVVDIPVDYRIAAEAVLLADRGFHPDPMDQVIAATAIVCGHELATYDRDIIEWAEHNPELRLVDPRR